MTSTGMTVALFLGHNHKTSFLLLLWTKDGSLFPFWPELVDPCTEQGGFVSGHPSAGEHKFCSNLPQIFGSYIIMYYMMCLECCQHQIYAFFMTDSKHIIHIFTSLTSWWRTWTFKIHSRSLMTWKMNTIWLYPTHGVIIKGFFLAFCKSQKLFFLWLKKLVAISLLFKVCHFIKLQQSQKALNMNTLKCQLQKTQH